MKTAALCLALAVTATPATAGSYGPLEGQHFVAVASSRNLDEAVGIARLYGDDAEVVSAQNGWYAVVLGPTAAASLAAFKEAYQGWPELPADAVWSSGKSYIDAAWGPDPLAPKSIELTTAAPVETGAEDFTVTAAATRIEDLQSVRLSGMDNGSEAFDLVTPQDYYSDVGATLRLANLDPTTPEPETMVTQYTGGAHCCVVTWFAAQRDGAWTLAEAATLDGGGYWLEDVDRDRSYELLSVDNAFLYAFDAYAGSFATIAIQRLRNGRLEPVPHDEVWRSRIVQDLAGKEFLARLDPGLWHSNGFLAPWAATKIILGEGEPAWRKMLANYDKSSDFGPQVCTSGEPIEQCPAGNLKPVPFPEALAAFLQNNGYTPVPSGR